MLEPLISMKLAVGPRPSYAGEPSLIELKKAGITAIVDLNQEPEERREAARTNLKYVADPRLEILDIYEPIPVSRLKYITMIIHKLILQGHYVYLHCTASRGRSPTIAAAYLICLGNTEEKARSLVKTVRTKAWDNDDDKKYALNLGEFEKLHRGDCKNI
jgi:protein-tyrosine phosphatase